MKTKYVVKKPFKGMLLLFGAILFSSVVMAQKPVYERSFEINLEDDEKRTTVLRDNIRYDTRTGIPVALYQVNFSVPKGTPESMAQYYLAKESKKIGIPKNELQNLRHHATRTTTSGSVVRFRQYLNGFPVNKAEVTISISPANKVVYIMSSYQAEVNLTNTSSSVTKERAYQLAFDYLNVKSNVIHTSNNLMVYKNSKMTRLAHEVVISSTEPLGEWHVLVDANTEEIFKVVDQYFYYCNHKDGDKKCTAKDNHKNCSHKNSTTTNKSSFVMASGTGNVFDPDPLSSATVAYGTGGYTDNADANSADLTSQTFTVPLLDITFSGGNYSLVGPYAEIVDSEAPNNGLFEQASSDFLYQRNDDRFEAVSVYYHIDTSMRHMNLVLGCNVMPYQYATGVRVDPSGVNGADNSHYSSGSGELAFGEGCVDDAEDSDVIYHELGHGIHDWVTAGGLSQVDGLSEGSGDYWAQSYNRSLGNWTPADAAHNYVFNWDGHNACWGGRTTDYGASYPGGLTGGIHADGQIWSTCLMKIYDIIGRNKTDKIFLEGLGMTNGSSSQNDAANAAYQSAINMGYSNAEIATIHGQFTSCGYTLPALPTPPVADFSADETVLCTDLGEDTVNFTDTSTGGTATSWAWVFTGGTPGTSTSPNPTVVYTVPGSYQVQLTATNSAGSDVMIKTGYINVVSGVDCPSCITASASTGLPATILNNDTMTSTLLVSGSIGMITDININNLIGVHPRLGQLSFKLTSPLGTEVQLISNSCANDDDFNVSLDDQAASATLPCPYTDGLSYQPVGTLADFNGESANGTWTLTITDNANPSSGSLTGWDLEVCTWENPLGIEENTINNFEIYPNPNKGVFTIEMNTLFESEIDIIVYDIRGRRVYNRHYESSSNFKKEVKMNSVQSGLYFIEVNNGSRKIVKKIIVE